MFRVFIIYRAQY